MLRSIFLDLLLHLFTGALRSEVLAGIWRTDIFPCIPARYALAIVSCLGFVNVYILRVNLSVAIVQMDVETASVKNGSARVSDKVKRSTLSLYFIKPQNQQLIVNNFRQFADV